MAKLAPTIANSMILRVPSKIAVKRAITLWRQVSQAFLNLTNPPRQTCSGTGLLLPLWDLG
ncbi:hypothetical protein [Microcoleus sp. S13_C5]|uniref:hypothetical protein n=1 Tax=Microcoleus sp. S13_C5 TaxID=3055411 RepID=UPI002FD09014